LSQIGQTSPGPWSSEIRHVAYDLTATMQTTPGESIATISRHPNLFDDVPDEEFYLEVDRYLRCRSLGGF
jgi:hypothetical protein